MIHELSRGSARGWYLRTVVVRLMSIPGTLVSQENMQFRQQGKQAGKAAIKCKFLFHVSSPAIVPDKFRRLLPHDVDKSQLATSLSLNSLSQNQVIRPNPPSHSRNEHLAGILFVSQHPLLSSPKRPTSREKRGWGGGRSWSKEIFTRYGLIVTSNIITPRGNISFIWKLVNGLCAIVGGHYQNGYKVLHPMLLLEAVAGVWKLVLQFVS